MKISSREKGMTSTITGKLQTTIPARLARQRGLRTGMRLEWQDSADATTIVVRILPDPFAGVREAQAIAAKNKKAGAKLAADFEQERDLQRSNGPWA
jgi:bifunctional DNA-binding transcriptional regulator/antitoxin component of YhaV-PrlF toxin-antitoxin module